MDSEFSSCDTLESMSQHGSSGPRSVSLEYLRNITNNFSEKLGEGGFGTVYKGHGWLPNGETVAVKKLNSSMLLPGVTDKQFENEAYHLKRLKHPNIVLLVGWCSETKMTYVEHEGKHICAEKSDRLLCLEYMPNGNLRQHLKDESSGLTWETRYKIIEGICYGLHYLHEESQLNGPIVHMDLKPENILLNNDMVPKIADFGFSRLFSEEKTKSTINRNGTLGYMPPEYIHRGIISTKSDIFSLGVIIIEIVTGQRDYPDETGGISSQEFTELVLTNWRNRLQKSLRDTSREIDYEQIRKCIQIGLDCVKLDRSKRPTIGQIIKMLQETESGSSGPRSVSLEYLRNITNNFSDDRLLGEGGFGTVYKGLLPNGETIAVKKLNSSMLPGVKDKQFENEARHLMRLKHSNIVLLLGWCTETENIYVEHNGKHICVEKSERLLCLEYMPEGNLRQYLSDEYSGLAWETRYKIIKGICHGLHYLHEERQLNAPIVHMDLKPANILLDNNMVPKIADFGLSRLFGEDKTWTCTTNRDGTLGYMAPEYINRGIISTKSDIFSLGVIIIEILTGHRDYPDETGGISSQEFIELALTNWRNRLQKSLRNTSLEIDYQQIRRCIQIGLDCVKLDRSKRPTISQVIKMLKETESAVQSHPTLIDDNQILSLGSHGFGVAPERMTREFLGQITNHFSEKQKLGSGTFGTVYKGVYFGEEFAVKMLHEIIGADETQFQNEFLNLLSINHPHIIKLIGYCYEIHNEHVQYYGKLRFSQRTNRAMCLEYMQGGSLEEYLTACYNGFCERDWRTLFNIIKGVCEGLYFLHEGFETPILHLDLKPANILLDHNIVAKIADFGLSRLFQGASTHVTQRESVTGTTKYMAPEYEYRKIMSPKNDVFSLGVTMIEVMAGPTGYDEFCEMGDVKKFIDQVNTDWTKQIKATASPCASTESDQVDICITIAMKCIDGERNNRPSIAEIVHILKETEKRIPLLLVDQSLSSHIIKSGVVGGKAGSARDIEEKPWRLESLTITYIGLVDAFSFSYIDKDGKQQTVGPWGADKGSSDAKTETILFEPSEFVEEVSGTYGSHFGKILMMSLTFVTNIRTYGPFGNPYYQSFPSTPFSFRAAEDSSIVGFHGRSGQFLYSLGVYMTWRPSNMKIPRPLPMPGQILPTPTKRGPWGGSAGIARDIQEKPWRLESLTISYLDLIDAFSFSYTDQDGKKQSNGRWGGGYQDDKIETIRFETSEFLEEVSGALGIPFGDVVLVMSLTFVTNIRTYGPFGDPYFQELRPEPFRFKADKDSRIVGFYGRSGKHLYSIGVYTI